MIYIRACREGVAPHILVPFQTFRDLVRRCLPCVLEHSEVLPLVHVCIHLLLLVLHLHLEELLLGQVLLGYLAFFALLFALPLSHLLLCLVLLRHERELIR